MSKLIHSYKTTSAMLNALFVFFCGLSLPAYAGSGSVAMPGFGNGLYGGPGTSTLRTPLVPGANFSLPFVPPAAGAPPPIGSGLTPLPVTPGMLTGPTLIPWANGTAGNPFSQPTSQVVVPAKQINVQNSKISLPISNSTALPPGTLNSQIRGSIPVSPSTPGEDPGMLRPPSFNNGSNAASNGQNYDSVAGLTAVGQNGQYPEGKAPTTRPKYQVSNDFGLKRQINGYRARFNTNNGQPVFEEWEPQQSSYTQDLGLKLQQLKSAGKLGKPNYQVSYDSPAPATYPGQSKGQPNQNSRGNHNNYPSMTGAQATNDLFGTPMINPNRNADDGNGNPVSPRPLTTVANY